MNQSIINSVQLLDSVYLTHVIMEDELLTYIDNRSVTSIFHVIDLITKETLQTIPIGILIVIRMLFTPRSFLKSRWKNHSIGGVRNVLFRDFNFTKNGFMIRFK